MKSLLNEFATLYTLYWSESPTFWPFWVQSGKEMQTIWRMDMLHKPNMRIGNTTNGYDTEMLHNRAPGVLGI